MSDTDPALPAPRADTVRRPWTTPVVILSAASATRKISHPFDTSTAYPNPSVIYGPS